MPNFEKGKRYEMPEGATAQDALELLKENFDFIVSKSVYPFSNPKLGTRKAFGFMPQSGVYKSTEITEYGIKDDYHHENDRAMITSRIRTLRDPVRADKRLIKSCAKFLDQFTNALPIIYAEDKITPICMGLGEAKPMEAQFKFVEVYYGFVGEGKTTEANKCKSQDKLIHTEDYLRWTIQGTDKTILDKEFNKYIPAFYFGLYLAATTQIKEDTVLALDRDPYASTLFNMFFGRGDQSDHDLFWDHVLAVTSKELHEFYFIHRAKGFEERIKALLEAPGREYEKMLYQGDVTLFAKWMMLFYTRRFEKNHLSRVDFLEDLKEGLEENEILNFTDPKDAKYFSPDFFAPMQHLFKEERENGQDDE